MDIRRKRIIALALSLTLLGAVSGCKKKEITLEVNDNTKQEELRGNLYKEDLKYYYIVESIDDKGYTNLSLVYDKNNNKSLFTKYGEIVSVIPFVYYVNEYSEEKDVYSASDIEIILNKIKSNKVKKLELK